MLPGRTKSLAGDARAGKATVTTRALDSTSCTVARNWRSRQKRGAKPITPSTTRMINVLTTIRTLWRFRVASLAGSSRPSVIPLVFSLNIKKRRSRRIRTRVLSIHSEWSLLAQQAIDDRHDEQRGERGECQAADDRARQGCVLLTALAKPQSHRQHADNHRQ